jgi:hypothetical protein
MSKTETAGRAPLDPEGPLIERLERHATWVATWDRWDRDEAAVALLREAAAALREQEEALHWLGEMGRVTYEAWLRRVHPEHARDGKEWEAMVRPMRHSVYGRTPAEALENAMRALEPKPTRTPGDSDAD